MSDIDLTLLQEDDDDGMGYARVNENQLYDEAVGPRRMTRRPEPFDWA